jgi:hypothetical protein
MPSLSPQAPTRTSDEQPEASNGSRPLYPPPIFPNHAVNTFGSFIFDPSYGAPRMPSLLAYEDASVASYVVIFVDANSQPVGAQSFSDRAGVIELIPQ